MKEPTFQDIWNNLLLPQVGKLLSDFDYLANFEFLNNYGAVKKEYDDLRTYVKEKMSGDDGKRIDRHKIAAAFAIAVAKIAQFGITKKKYDKENLDELDYFEFLLKMNCNKLGQYIIDYVLAWKVGLNILRFFSIKEEEEKGNSDYANFLRENIFSFPETSEKFSGSDYEVQAIRALYLTIPKNYVQFSERRGIFFLANIFCLIEKYSKTKFDLRLFIANSMRRKYKNLS